MSQGISTALKEKMMNRLISAMLATTLTASFAVAVPMTASAMQLQGQTVSSDIQSVDYNPVLRNHSRNNNNMRMHKNNSGMWHGHRGYSDYRPGYRRHGDLWFPLAAFATGALITGAIANQNSGGSSHEQACAEHYRSYRASDNTFQPNNGPRQQCNY